MIKPIYAMWILFTFLGLQNLAVRAETITVDLSEATVLTLQANPDLAVAMRGREIESGQQLQAASRPNPTLSGEVHDLRSQNRVTTIAISQKLETADKRDKRMVAAGAAFDIAEVDIHIAQAEISAKTYAAFYQLLAAQQVQKLAQELLEIATTTKDTTTKRVLAGKISPVEETKAKVAEASLKIDLANSNQQLAISKQRLASLWAKSEGQTDYVVVGELENLKELPKQSELMAQLADSPRLKKAALAIQEKQAISNIELSKQTPDVTVSLGAQRNEELGGITQAMIGLSIPIPVFDKNQGNLLSAKAREYQSIDEKTALENQLQTELKDAYSRRQLQVEASNMYKQDILQGAQSAYEAARKGFEYGKFSFLEVLDAQRTLFQAKMQFIQTLTMAHIAEADIQRILGRSNLKETP